jgi:HK97 family phage major capsid protein
MNVKELGEQLHAKRGELAELLKDTANMTADQVKEAQRVNTEVTEIAKKYEDARAVEDMKAANDTAIYEYKTPANPMQFGNGNGNGREQKPEPKGIGELLRESKAYAAFRNRGATGVNTAVLNIPEETDFKTLMTLTTINNVATRLPGPVVSAQEERTVADLMLPGTTDNNTITYMEETTFTNSAAEVAEGGTKPESALAFTERTDNVRKIATWIPATTELLDDVAGIQSYIEGRLMFMVKRREELQLLVGDGTAPNISGILDRSGIQTQAKGADPTPDAVYKAMTKVRNTGFAEPTAAVFHPNDWQDIRLLRTADGIYIWGSPADAGPERIWGLDVRITTALTENTGLVGAFRPFAQIFRRKGITITISTEHSTYFVENKVAILAETRLALAVYRPAAFCTITGI